MSDTSPKLENPNSETEESSYEYAIRRLEASLKTAEKGMDRLRQQMSEHQAWIDDMKRELEQVRQKKEQYAEADRAKSD